MQKVIEPLNALNSYIVMYVGHSMSKPEEVMNTS